MLTQDDKQRLLTAKTHYDAKEYSDALIILSDLLLAHPTNSDLFFEIAKTYQKMNQTKLAMANFDRAIKNATTGQPYALRKEFAELLASNGHFRNANIAYLPILNEPKNEKDLIIGIEYLLHNGDFDTAERTIIDNALQYPNMFDIVCANPLNDTEAIETLKERKSNILHSVRNNFTSTLEKHTATLNDFIKNTQEGTLDHLVVQWYNANQTLKEATNITNLVAAQNNILTLGERFEAENKKLETQQKDNILKKLRKDNLAQLQALKNVEVTLKELLPQLPATSLKTQIPTFLQNSKNVQEQTKADNVILAQKAYLQLNDLTQEGQSLIHQGQSAIATITAMETPTEKRVTPSHTKVSTERHEYRQSEPDNVVVLDSQLNKRSRTLNRWMILLILVIIIGGGVATYLIHFANNDDSTRVLLTNVFMRQQASMDSDKVSEDSYKEGETLKLLNYYGDWLRLEATDGKTGYMRSEYLVKPSENEFLNGIYDSETTGTLFESARHKLALLSYFKQNEWTSNVPSSIEKKVFGHTEFEREMRQVFGNIPEDKLNTVKINKWTNHPDYKKQDMAVIIRGKETEQLVFFSFREDNSFNTVTDMTLEGIGHQLEFIDYTKTNQSWCLSGGTPLASNAVLVHSPTGQETLYIYNREMDEMISQSQDACY